MTLIGNREIGEARAYVIGADERGWKGKTSPQNEKITARPAFAASMALMQASVDRRFGFAWIGFGMAVAIHVLDEAAHDFLAFYNPNARAIRARLPFLPLPVFTFETWLASLATGIAIFLCLSPFAFRGMRWARIAAGPVSIVVGILNACAHMLSSIYYHRWMPGVYSSPLLLLAAGFLISAARSRHREAANAAAAR